MARTTLPKKREEKKCCFYIIKDSAELVTIEKHTQDNHSRTQFFHGGKMRVTLPD